MIKGIGVDVVEISRMAKFIARPNFITSVFTESETKNAHGDLATYYATRFACKEAVFKATSMNFDWRKVETLNRKDGSPVVTITEELKAAGVKNIYISISTEAGLAVAYCVVE